ncbi:MAG: tetratricopeptide repeat protein [Elusimicrobia bacterium]|nr:tetratricopeptide repeat protein [Elusimicrobiota bacterium]
MEYANKKLGGIVHGDIKPQNILITEDRIVKITDFGLTKSAGKEAKGLFYLLKKGATILQSGPRGTLPWIAPEQFTSNEIDTRADIYSFGIVLYQMFTGGYPYVVSTATPEEFVANHCKLKPIPPLKFNSEIPEELNSLVLKCLEKDTKNRFQNFTELKNELSDIYYETTGEKIVLEEEPSKLEAWELGNKGNALNSLGKYAEAIECYDKVLEINPRDAESWNNKGDAFGKLGKYNEEIGCYNKALEINPRLADAWTSKGAALGNLGKYDEAIKCCGKALEINPDLKNAYNLKQILYSDIKKG